MCSASRTGACAIRGYEWAAGLASTRQPAPGRKAQRIHTSHHAQTGGGANVVLAESLGSVGTHLHAGPSRRIVGVDINATHHKAATSGFVTGVATAVSLGKTLCVYEIVITNEAGQRTCSARITCMILAER